MAMSGVIGGTTPAADPEITLITSLGGGNWELTLKGEPSTAYEFDSSTTLVFPGTPVHNLVQGAKGVVSGTNSEILTTDVSGDAKVQMSLGAVPANFVRAVGP